MRSRESILEATRVVIGRAGFTGVNIAAVAKQAGVSRQTVYSIFGSREELVSQAIADRLTALLGAYDTLFASAGSPLDLMVELMVEARRHILGDPLLRVLALSEQGHPIFDAGAAERARQYAEGLLAPAMERFPELGPHVGFLADVGVHLGWSVLCLDDPGSRSDDSLRTFLTALLAPMIATLDP